MTMRFGLGICLWTQAEAWPRVLQAAELVDELRFDHLWSVDHWLAPHGDPEQAILDGWMVLSGWATRTRHVRLGLFVGANTFRSPTQTAKLATTLDHLSDGRAMLGLGAGWFEAEHRAYGVEFGRSPGERIGWLDESAGLLRRLLDGETVTHAGERYRAERLRLLPRPIQPHLPILMGGSGERRTLRVVATHADIWNTQVTIDELPRKLEALRGHCESVGRDFAEIELTLGAFAIIRPTREEAQDVFDAQMAANRVTPEDSIIDPEKVWLGPPEAIVERLRPFRELGIRALVIEMPAPIDLPTIRSLATEVRPLLEAER